MLNLRPYQSDAIKALYEWFEAHEGNPLVVMPTGTGKSVVIGAFIRGAVEGFPDTRVLCLTHVKELIEQDFAALVRLWPDAPAGIYSAGLNSRDLHSQIIFGGIQSLHRRAYDLQRVDLVLIDEAHLVPRDSATMYRRFLDALRQINPYLKVVGFSATPYRLDSGMLHKGKDALFGAVAYEVKLLDMIEQGYLAPVTAKQTQTQMDVSGVHKRGGEFIPGELEAAINVDDVTRPLVAETIEKAGDRGSWLVFAAGVDHAEALRKAFADQDIEAACVFGDTVPGERMRLISLFRRGDLRCLINVNVLTTGFDAPGVDLIVMARPTASVGLYVQMIGRGTRLAEGKENCLILDFAGNVHRHGPVDMAKFERGERGEVGGEAPVKVCPSCKEIVHAAVRQCPECGHEFPPPVLKLSPKAHAAPVLSTEINDWLDIASVSYRRHTKIGSPPSLVVTYWSGMMTYREWVCLEHTGYAREKAAKWWARRAPGSPVPSSIDEALEHADALPKPKQIRVCPQGKYFDIVGVRF